MAGLSQAPTEPAEEGVPVPGMASLSKPPVVPAAPSTGTTGGSAEHDPAARYAGKVSYYSKWKGFGFIELSDKGVVPSDKLFVRWHNIQTDDRFPFLAAGLEVECGVMKWRDQPGWWKSPSTLRAKTVTLLGGENIALQDRLDSEKKEFVGGQGARFTGQMKFYNPKGGYGYIAVDEGQSLGPEVAKELRVERAEVNAGGKQAQWMDACPVEFGIWKTMRGVHKAYNMTLPGGTPLTQEALEHRVEIGDAEFKGEIKIWNFRQGWGFIKMDASLVFPAHVQAKLTEQTKAAKDKATIRGTSGGSEELVYFRSADIKKGERVQQNQHITFQIYTDDKGVGAYDVAPAPQ